MVRESCWRSIVWVNTVCVWRRADTSRAGERESVCVCVCVCVETGRHKQSWRPRELRLCSHCTDGLIEDELHFLTECSKYKHIRDAYFKQIALVSPEFQQTSNTEKLSYILERRKSASTWQRSMCTPATKWGTKAEPSSPFTLALCILLIYCCCCFFW